MSLGFGVPFVVSPSRDDSQESHLGGLTVHHLLL